MIVARDGVHYRVPRYSYLMRDHVQDHVARSVPVATEGTSSPTCNCTWTRDVVRFRVPQTGEGRQVGLLCIPGMTFPWMSSMGLCASLPTPASHTAPCELR